MLGASDKLAIRLKLMINLLEGMHFSDHILETWGFLKYKLNLNHLTV